MPTLRMSWERAGRSTWREGAEEEVIAMVAGGLGFSRVLLELGFVCNGFRCCGSHQDVGV